MTKRLLLILTVLALAISGLLVWSFSRRTPPPIGVMPSDQGERGSQAEYVERIFARNAPWKEYQDPSGRITFSYPEGLFNIDDVITDYRSGVRYLVEERPTVGEDGVCDALADIDCDIVAWPQQYANFEAALEGREVYRVGYESFSVAQQVRTIGGKRFVVNVNQGLNGWCEIVYSYRTPTVHVLFGAYICDDSPINQDKWLGSVVDEDERIKVENILNGTNRSSSTRIKMEAIERVLATLERDALTSKSFSSTIFPGLSFTHPETYQVEDGGLSRSVVSIKKGDRARIEVFHEDPTSERVFGFGDESPTREELDGYVPKQMLKKAGFDVWVYYREGDIGIKQELQEIVGSMRLESRS